MRATKNTWPYYRYRETAGKLKLVLHSPKDVGHRQVHSTIAMYCYLYGYLYGHIDCLTALTVLSETEKGNNHTHF